jgi:hypothetical protein
LLLGVSSMPRETEREWDMAQPAHPAALKITR